MPPAETPRPDGAPARPSMRLMLMLGAAVLALAGGTYAWLGNPAAWRAQGGPGTPGTQGVPPAAPVAPETAASTSPATAAAHANAQIVAMVQRLSDRLARQPDDAEGWAMLGRSRLVLNEPAEAVAAFQKRRALQPQDPQALVDLADALAFAAGRKFEGEPETLLVQALKLDPRNAKALELTGTMAFDRGQYAQAVQQWQAALAVLDPQSPAALNLQAGVAEAQRRGGPTVAATAGAQVSGRIVLAAALKARIQPDDTVLIFARLVDGPRMPVAVLKRKASELPLDFKLDESTAMNPSLRLSPSMRVVVGARISRSGQALPQAGDLQGYTAPVAVGTGGLQIEINEIVK